MHKTLLIYPSFIIAFLLVAVLFITSNTYIQLGIAIISYPLLAFLAYKAFLNKKLTTGAARVEVELPEKVKTKENIGIADIDKRTFLKLIGATGISFLLISLFGRRIESLVFTGQNLAQAPSIGSLPAGKTGTAASSPTDGYNISEIDDSIVGYYGFINKDSAWFIMKRDTNTGAFRYAKGASDFPKNWKNRENLKYDYSDNVFVY